MSAEQINDFATYLALTGAVPSTLAFFTFVLGRPRTWWRSFLGWVLALLLFALFLVFVLVLGRRLLGEYPGYAWTAILVYAVLTVALWLVFVIIIYERRRGRALGFIPIENQSRKEFAMSNTPINAETVPPIWYKAQRTIRSVVAVIVAIATSLGGSLAVIALVAPQVLDELRPLLSPEVFGWLAGAVATIVVLSGAVTRIMAIPGVNAFLTKFGAGSVPKSAIIDAGRVLPDKAALITSLPEVVDDNEDGALGH